MTSLSRITKNEFLKNILTLVSASGVAQAVALAIYPALSRIYTPAEHGLFALYMSVISVTAMLSTGKYELAVMIPGKDRDGAGLVKLGIILAFGISLILLAFILVFYNDIPQWLGNEGIKRWLLFVPLSTFLVAVFQCLSNWSNRHKRYKSIAGANLGQSLLNSSVKLSASKVAGGGGGLILGAIAGQILGVFLFIRSVFKYGTGIFRKVHIADLKRLAREYRYFPEYNLPHYLTNNLSSALPVFIISSYFSPDQVGFYSFGFMMVNRPMNLLTSSFTQVFSQKIIESFNKGEKVAGKIKKFVLRLLMLAIVPFSLAALFGPGIFTFVFGENWHEAGVYMRILLPWLFMVFLSSPLSFLPDMLSRQKKAMWIDLVKFLLRILALSIGVILNNIYIALILFSGISFIMVSYSLYWYVNLSGLADRINSNQS